MESLLKQIQDFLHHYGCERTYWIAYSGGLDSQVLLHSFSMLRALYPLRLRAVHINHHLSSQANFWAEQCQNFCKELGIELIQKSVTVTRQNLEESARAARYAIFEKYMAPDDILLTAHHQDDQVETVLLQLLRGAGPKGLSGMPAIKSFGKGFHARPLLNIPRVYLKKYAEEYHLTWIEDESNQNTQFNRNFLRHHIIPELKTRWPSLGETISRSALHCAETQEWLEKEAQKKLNTIQGTREETLSVKKLSQYSLLEQTHLLRLWIEERKFPAPSTVKMRQIQQDLIQSRYDKTPCLSWANVEMRRFRDDLYLMLPLPPHNAQETFEWNLTEPLILPGIGKLVAENSDSIKNKSVTVRFRQGGEKCQLPGRAGHHSLKKLFQEWNVPPWERDRVPLIYNEGKLAAVVGFWANEELLSCRVD